MKVFKGFVLGCLLSFGNNAASEPEAALFPKPPLLNGAYEKQLGNCKEIISNLIVEPLFLNDQKIDNSIHTILKIALENLNKIPEGEMLASPNYLVVFMENLVNQLNEQLGTKSIFLRHNSLEIYKSPLSTIRPMDEVINDAVDDPNSFQKQVEEWATIAYAQ